MLSFVSIFYCYILAPPKGKFDFTNPVMEGFYVYIINVFVCIYEFLRHLTENNIYAYTETFVFSYVNDLIIIK